MHVLHVLQKLVIPLAEAFGSAVYHVHNRTLKKVLKGLTPFEALFADLVHLRAFGMPCSMVEPLEKWSQFYEDRPPPPMLSETHTQPPPVVQVIGDGPQAGPITIQ